MDINAFIFAYSIGLAMTLTGFNILVDVFPDKFKTKIKILIGVIFLVGGILLMAHSLGYI